MSTPAARVFNRAAPQSLSSEILRVSAQIAAVLEGEGTAPRLTRARSVVAEARRVRDEARAGLSVAIQANVGTNGAVSAVQAAARELERHEANVKAARQHLADQTSAAEPAMAAALQPHLAVVGFVVEQLLDLLEQALDPLTGARRFLSDHSFSLLRLIGIAPVLSEHLRAMRALLNEH